MTGSARWRRTWATDLGDGQLHGSVNGPLWAGGLYGAALSFDGVDDEVLLPPLNSSGASMTLSAWIRRSGSQFNGAGIVMAANAGLHFGAFNELRYSWANSLLTLLSNPGFSVPGNIWVFVALVVDPSQATLYLGDGTTLQSATNAVPHLSQDFAGETKLGTDPAFAGRFFAGDMDEERLWDYALSPGEINDLWGDGGRAELPSPSDGGLAPDAVVGLLFTRDANSVAGINCGNNNELRYHWNGASNTWGFDSQLVLPDKTWCLRVCPAQLAGGSMGRRLAAGPEDRRRDVPASRVPDDNYIAPPCYCR